MLRIGLAYINGSNLGDVVIYETTRYMIGQILQQKQVQDYELVPIQICSSNAKAFSFGYFARRKAAKAEARLKELLRQTKDPDVLEAAVLEKWHCSRPYLYFLEYEQAKLKGLDGVILVGGGLIKFHKQTCHYHIHEITQIAEREHFPVFLNAVGVEGYNEDDPDCRLLKKALNRDCVKYISTRDDFETLQRHYVEKPDTVIEAVCDPALWSKECYQITPTPASKKIGLGVIRPEIFKDYLYYVNQNLLIDIYFALAKRITEMGYQVELFSNGLPRDNLFIDTILQTYPFLTTKYHVSVATPETTEELVATIAQYDRFVNIRLHASIIGCSLGIPNVGVVWNKKQLLFGQHMGLINNYITKKDFDEDIILEKLFQAERKEANPAYKESVYNGLITQISIIEKEKMKQS